MSKPDFQRISVDELRTYMLAHREDQEAFHALMDRLAAQTPLAVLEPGDVSNLKDVIQRVEQLKQQRTQQPQETDMPENG